MREQRPTAARIIAAVIAVGGTPYAIGIAFAAFVNPAIPLFFAPGWFVYFALIWTILDRRLRWDPFTTWVPCILVHGFLAWQLNPYFEFDPRDSPLRHYTTIYIWAAVPLSAIGLTAELTSSIPAGDYFRRVRQWLNSR